MQHWKQEHWQQWNKSAWNELIIPDETGCSHVLACIFEDWQCSRCERVLTWIYTATGQRLQIIRAEDDTDDLFALCLFCSGGLLDDQGDMCRPCKGTGVAI